LIPLNYFSVRNSCGLVQLCVKARLLERRWRKYERFALDLRLLRVMLNILPVFARWSVG
jgi:hypothetical protein